MSTANQKGGRVRSKLGVMLAQHQLDTGRKITQAELAKATETRPSTISKWMSPEPLEKIDSGVLERLCDYFNCDVGDILFIDRRRPTT
jgi:DNA-binding Xre family transcriptional regulator